MALIAIRTKISRILSALPANTSLSRPPFCSNGGANGFASSAVASLESRSMGLEILGVKDYEDYRRSLYGEITHKALLVDAVGTLLVPSQPMAQVSSSLSELVFFFFACLNSLCLFCFLISVLKFVESFDMFCCRFTEK